MSLIIPPVLVDKPTFQLRPNQVPHFERIKQILQKFYFYVDGSEMGTGKTYVATAVAKHYNLPCIVVCPLAARKTWVDVLGTYGVGVYNLPETGGVLTYDTLRTRKGLQPKHGLLSRSEGSPVQFFGTEMLRKIIEAGVLIIFDECQKLKNTSAQFLAAKEVVRQIYAFGSKSRIALLSGTVMDKAVHAVNFLRMVGFINHRNLYTKIRGKPEMKGVSELYEWSMRIDPVGTQKFLEQNPFKYNSNEAIDHVFALFSDVIRPKIMSIMQRNPTSAIKDVKNGFYYMDKEDVKNYELAINQLSSVLRYNPETGAIIQKSGSMGAVTNALVLIQCSKVRAMIRVAKETLAKISTNEKGEKITPKIVLFADYYEVINEILKELKEYSPVELTGRISEKKRNSTIDAFQMPSSDVRVLVGNPLVGGLAVSLHDTTGLFPRYMYVMSGYRANELHQATGRIYRDGVVGTAYIRFFYGLSGTPEKCILDALSRKGEVMGTVHKEQSDYGVQFPHEYEDEYETDDLGDVNGLPGIVPSNMNVVDFETESGPLLSDEDSDGWSLD